MTILKPGKVEQMKFVCPKCGCVFVASTADIRTEGGYDGVSCPEHRCSYFMAITHGEPYEEPTTMQTDRDRLIELLDEMDIIQSSRLAGFLIRNGVTFRE